MSCVMQLEKLAEEEFGSEDDTAVVRAVIKEVQQACASVAPPSPTARRLAFGGIVVCGGREEDWTPAK